MIGVGDWRRWRQVNGINRIGEEWAVKKARSLARSLHPLPQYNGWLIFSQPVEVSTVERMNLDIVLCMVIAAFSFFFLDKDGNNRSYDGWSKLLYDSMSGLEKQIHSTRVERWRCVSVKRLTADAAFDRSRQGFLTWWRLLGIPLLI